MKTLGSYTAPDFLQHIIKAKNTYLAEYHAARKTRNNKPRPKKPDWSWTQNVNGSFVLRIKNRRPSYLTREEYGILLEDMVKNGRDLTERDLQSTLTRRKISIKE